MFQEAGGIGPDGTAEIDEKTEVGEHNLMKNVTFAESVPGSPPEPKWLGLLTPVLGSILETLWLRERTVSGEVF